MSTASDGLSQEEFLRLQEQLLELRNVNYELKEKLKKATTAEGDGSSSKRDALQFTSRLLNRANSEKETQQRLDAELDCLRLKLQQQEEEFRLQQQTFILELNNVVKANEDLQRRLEGAEDKAAEKERQQLIDRLQKEKGRTEEENCSLRERITGADGQIQRLDGELREQIDFVKAFEDTVLGLRQEKEDLMRSREDAEAEGAGKLVKISELLEEAQRRGDEMGTCLAKKEEEIRQMEMVLREAQGMEGDLLSRIDSLTSKLSDKDSLLDELRNKNVKCTDEMEKLRSAKEEIMSTHQEALSSTKKDYEERLSQLEQEHLERRQTSSNELDNALQKKEVLHETELNLLKSNFDREKRGLVDKLERLANELQAKDEEKQLALKKQSFMIKELQKAVKEERKRADSVDKLKERDWQVVDSDAKSNLTYDGNESVSSLSALESDNVELINKLTKLQKSYAEVVDQMKHTEFENENLRKEVLEKGEVIEHWIRSRPTPTAAPTMQKNENPLRKLLTTTLGDDQVNDLRDMNRKLQRMLEETLSKNIILQRDLQTLLERTEM